VSHAGSAEEPVAHTLFLGAELGGNSRQMVRKTQDELANERNLRQDKSAHCKSKSPTGTEASEMIKSISFENKNRFGHFSDPPHRWVWRIV
jgi:hypothetical protein